MIANDHHSVPWSLICESLEQPAGGCGLGSSLLPGTLILGPKLQEQGLPGHPPLVTDHRSAGGQARPDM